MGITLTQSNVDRRTILVLIVNYISAVMFKKMLNTFVLVALVFLSAPAANAETSSTLEVVARMKEIAVEMQKLQAEFTTLAAQLSAGAGSASVLGAQTSVPGNVFTKSLVYGETNDDIKKVQRLLATDSDIYPYCVASGFFGPKTEEAIRNLQTRFGLDPVGVIGPATTALLEGYFKQYPDGNFPDGVLATKPRVLGASTNGTGVDVSGQIAVLQQQLSSLTGGSNTSSSNPAKSIEAEFDFGETVINVKFNDGRKSMRIVTETENKDEVVAYVVKKTDLTESQVRALIEFEDTSSTSSDADEGDAEDALADADDALADARDEIRDAADDDEDTDWAEEAYDEARDLYRDAEDAFDEEDWDEAVDLAREAEELAEEAIDRIGDKKGKSSGDIEDIFAYIGDGETEVYVAYDDDDEEFTVQTDSESKIIREIADELDLDKDEVEDLITLYGKKVDYIEVEIDTHEGRSYAHIEFEDGE